MILTATKFDNQSVFYNHAVSIQAQSLTHTRFDNTNVFYPATIIGGAQPAAQQSNSGLVMLYDNQLKSSTLTATSTASGFDVNNLMNNDKTSIWRSSNLSDQIITSTFAATKSVSGVGIAFSNLHEGSSYRVRVYSTSGSSTPIYDSGFIAVNYAPVPPVGFDTIGYLSFSYGGGNSFLHTFTEQQVQKVDVTFRSAGNPDGAIEASTIIAGQITQLIRGASYGATPSYNDDTDRVKIDGGSTIVDIKPTRKEMSFSIENMPQVDMKKLAALYRRVGARLPVFCSLLSNDLDEEEKEHFQIYGYLDQDGLSRISYSIDSTSIKVTSI